MRDRQTKARRSNVAFLSFFTFYTLSAMLWLSLGFAPALAAAFPSVHESLHRWGLGARTTNIWVFDEDGFNQNELVFRAGDAATIVFNNQDAGAQHNLAIYADASAGEAIFKGDIITGPAHRTYTFTLPPAGSYYFRCDVHPAIGGPVTVHEATTRVPAWASRFPLMAALARGVAVASHRTVPAAQIALQELVSLLNLGLAVFLVWLRPRERTARLLAVGMVGTAAVFNLQAHSVFSITLGMMADTSGLFLVDLIWHMPFHVLSGIAYIYALLLFPDGKLVPRWSTRRWFTWPLRILYILILACVGFFSGLITDGEPEGIVTFFGLIIPIAGLISQAFRFRRATDPVERQQSRVLMWTLALALSAGVLFAVLNLVLNRLGPRLPGETAADVRHFVFLVFPLLLAVIPITLFVVMVRYRLWDIDRVINRTLVYTTLSGILGLTYLVSVMLLQQIFRVLTGQEQTNLVTVVSTLAIATLFQPLRRRVQDGIDRRFYRRKYNAAQTLAFFNATLVQGMDLNTLTEDLVAVVEETMQPAHVSLWLRQTDQEGLTHAS